MTLRIRRPALPATPQGSLLAFADATSRRCLHAALLVCAATGSLVHAAPGIVDPADGGTVTGSSATFSWTPDGETVDAWFINLGTAKAARDIASSPRLTDQISFAVDGLPQDGSTIHARLFAWVDGEWLVADSSYTSASAAGGTDTPAEPVAPTEPDAPAAPVTPTEPDAPAAPVTPTTPSSPDSSLTLGKDATPPSSAWTRPALGAAYTDPVYGTPNRRISDAGGTRFDRNTYSRRQAESPDGTRFMTYHGTARHRIYARGSLELIRELDIHPDSEPQWHPTDSDIIRHIRGPNSSAGDLRLYETSVSSGETTAVADLTDRLRAVYPGATYMKDKAEGTPSADGSRYAWIVHDGSEQPVGIVSYDLSTDTILGTRAVRTDVGRLDWVSASPTGNYVMAGYVNATTVHGSDLADERRVNDKADHSDIALDAAGRDAYVYIDFSAGTDGGWLVSLDLATLNRTRLIDFYDQANTSLHVSGKGYDKPGWVVVSTYNCKVDGAWSCDKVFAVEMQSNPTIVNLAHTYNCGDNYWTETHAVVNRDFSRVYYNSDAGRCTTEAEVYELSLPALP